MNDVWDASVEDVLTACLRRRLGTDPEDRLLEVARGVDWQAVACRAIDERLGPLVYSELRCLEGVDEEAVALLEREHAHVAAANLVARRELEEIVEALGQVGIDALVLKGVALLADTYGSLASRPMRDLDVLIPPSRVEEALAVLVARGYKIVPALWGLGLIVEVSHEAQLHPAMPGKQMSIDLHWVLLGGDEFRSSKFMEWVWQRSRRLDDDGPLRGLSREAELLHHVGHLHLGHPGETRLLYDLAELVVRHCRQIDWDEVFVWARACRLETALRDTVANARSRWHFPLEPAFERLLRERVPRKDSYRAGGESLMYQRWDQLRRVSASVGWGRALRAYALPSRETMTVFHGAHDGLPLAAAHVRRWLRILQWN